MRESSYFLQLAEDVLNQNNRGGWTVPAPGLYPHQWLWDSCFIAIGLRHIDPTRAAMELTSLLRGQWQNGMMPHMIFSPRKWWFDDERLWRSKDNSMAPRDVGTSGITQPPLLAEATSRVAEKLDSEKSQDFLNKMVPAIVRYHEWLYRERDPHGNGLVYLLHPWETGLDNSPAWSDTIKSIHTPLSWRVFDYLHLDFLLGLLRRDTKYVPADQRIRIADAMRLYHAMRDLRRRHFSTEEVLAHPHRHFIIASISFNSMLIRNNQILMELAAQAGVDIPDWLSQRFELATKALLDMCDPVTGVCYHHDYDMRSKEEEPSISILMPLYSGVATKHQAQQLVGLLKNENFFWAKYPIPSTPLNSSYFSEKRFWQGPTWLNTNWLIADGLRRQGFSKDATYIRDRSLDLIEKSGISEYYSPMTGVGYGAKNFSWTAACFLDFACSDW